MDLAGQVVTECSVADQPDTFMRGDRGAVHSWVSKRTTVSSESNAAPKNRFSLHPVAELRRSESTKSVVKRGNHSIHEGLKR